MHKGKKSSGSLRPTSGKVREALFDILRSRMADARFLDLYAGTGAVGIEALRQGASETVFVEAGRTNAELIRRSLERSGLGGKCRIISMKVLNFIEGAGTNDLPFDIIFLDPPYHGGEIMLALSLLGKTRMLSSGGIVVAEHFAKVRLPDSFDKLYKVRDYTYGDTMLSLYKMYEGQGDHEEDSNISRDI